MLNNTRYQGTVKWFNSSLSYGFITLAESNEDIFLHIDEVRRRQNVIITPNTGDQFEFYIERGPRGPKATCIDLVSLASKAAETDPAVPTS